MTKINSTIHILIICLGFLFLIVYIKSIDSARNKDFEYLLNYNRELAKEIHYLKNPIEADCKYKLNGIIGEDGLCYFDYPVEVSKLSFSNWSYIISTDLKEGEN